jgi:hypothetical protein
MTKKITFLVSLILLSFFSSKAAVIYVNPNPDITYNTNGAQDPGIDIDNDGTIDIKFRLDFQQAPPGANADYFYHIGGLTTGSQAMLDAGLGNNLFGVPYWKKLTAGTAIGPASANFQSNTNFPEPLLGDGENNNIINAGDCLIGIKFKIGNNIHYAWMRVNLTGAVTGLVPNVIKDWAYESTANTAIAAGDMGGGTTNVAVTGIAVNGQGGASTITTNDGTLQMTATITPANATNQAVTWSVTNGPGSATISATGLLTAQNNGTVTVKATAQDGSNVSGTKTITISGQTVGIKEINKLASSIYPNPVKDELILQFGKDEDIRNIRICNVAGQVVFKNEDAAKSKLITINTASLPEGLYILTFENAEGKKGLQKFIKSK